jgi:transposase
MDTTQHRHDISDHVWELLEPHLPVSVAAFSLSLTYG